jgi:predicted RNA-binding Zn-ribbon protein involved in translation (DUF1610 family)
MKNFLKCNNCGYKKIIEDIKNLKEVVNNCSKCGKSKIFKCPKCGMYAKMFNLKQ